MLSRATKTILVLTVTKALKIEVHRGTQEATSVSGSPSCNHRLSNATVLQNLTSELASPLPSHLLLIYMTEHLSPPCSQCGSVQDLFHYFPHASRDMEVGHQVKHLKSTVSYQGRKGSLS